MKSNKRSTRLACALRIVGGFCMGALLLAGLLLLMLMVTPGRLSSIVPFIGFGALGLFVVLYVVAACIEHARDHGKRG